MTITQQGNNLISSLDRMEIEAMILEENEAVPEGIDEELFSSIYGK